MADFVPSIGFENCPKCGGWQVLDKSTRKPNGWPIGPLLYVACDNCFGKGEVAAKSPVTAWPVAPEAAWAIPAPKRNVAPPMEIETVPMPADLTECEHSATVEVWGKVKCADCNRELN